jgi:hypothetical protein
MTGVESLVTRIDRSDLLRLAAPAAEAAGGWFERRPHGLGRVGPGITRFGCHSRQHGAGGPRVQLSAPADCHARQADGHNR